MSKKTLLDLLPPDKAKEAVERVNKRLEKDKSRRGLDVTPEQFLVAEMGYYFGWEGIMTIRRGYTIDPLTHEKQIFTLEEAMVLLEGARKVWYTKMKDQAHAGMIGNSFKVGEKTSFESATRPFTERSEIKE